MSSQPLALSVYLTAAQLRVLEIQSLESVGHSLGEIVVLVSRRHRLWVIGIVFAFQPGITELVLIRHDDHIVDNVRRRANQGQQRHKENAFPNDFQGRIALFGHHIP